MPTKGRNYVGTRNLRIRLLQHMAFSYTGVQSLTLGRRMSIKAALATIFIMKILRNQMRNFKTYTTYFKFKQIYIDTFLDAFLGKKGNVCCEITYSMTNQSLFFLHLSNAIFSNQNRS